MTINEQFELVKYSIKSMELNLLFLGKGTYKNENLKHIPADIPCDVSAILKYGLYPLYKDGDISIPNVLSNTIVDFLNDNPIEVWMAYSIVWMQYRNELNGISPFNIISSELLETLRICITKNQKALSDCKKYVGDGKENGLLEDIIVSNKSFKNKFEVSIL